MTRQDYLYRLCSNWYRRCPDPVELFENESDDRLAYLLMEEAYGWMSELGYKQDLEFNEVRDTFAIIRKEVLR